MSRYKQIAINIVLVVFVLCSIAAVSIPFISELRYNSGEKLISRYLWKEAEDAMKDAIRIDPYNSRYRAGLAAFLFNQAKYKDNKTPLLNKAYWLYDNAAKLNPSNAEYLVKQGQVSLSLFVEIQKPGYIKLAFDNFKKAVMNDPNGFNTAYAVGYSGLAVLTKLSESDRALVTGRLKYSLAQKPWYSEYIYPHVMRQDGSAELLSSIMPEAELKQWLDPKEIDAIRLSTAHRKVSNIVSRQDWQGRALTGDGVYENGNMYWSGTIYGSVLFPEGRARIKIEAKASPADGIYPYVLLSIDGKRVGSVYVNSAEYKKYSFAVDTDGGIKVLGITFTNDGGNINEDRNLYVSNAQVGQR